MSKSCGIILFYIENNKIYVLLGHPGGPYNKGRGEGKWGILKGKKDEKDKDDFDCAIREFEEESGFLLSKELKKSAFFLEEIMQSSNKKVLCWAIKYKIPPDFVFKSNIEKIEYPKKSGNFIKIPEIDEINYFEISEAKNKIHKKQRKILNKLEEEISENGKRK